MHSPSNTHPPHFPGERVKLKEESAFGRKLPPGDEYVVLSVPSPHKVRGLEAILLRHRNPTPVDLVLSTAEGRELRAAVGEVLPIDPILSDLDRDIATVCHLIAHFNAGWRGDRSIAGYPQLTLDELKPSPGFPQISETFLKSLRKEVEERVATLSLVKLSPMARGALEVLREALPFLEAIQPAIIESRTARARDTDPRGVYIAGHDFASALGTLVEKLEATGYLAWYRRYVTPSD